MPAAARVGDHHACPKAEPGPVPHVGGAILPAGCTSVLIHDQPAARVGDRAKCNAPTDTIVMGEPSVLVGGKPAARVGDPTSHGGVIVAGCSCVQIGRLAQAVVMKEAAVTGAAFAEECPIKKALREAKQGKGSKQAAEKKPESATPATPAASAKGGKKLGGLSRKYECGNRGPGTIAHNAGDLGGASYGSYQIATNTGTMRQFLNGLRTSNPDYYAQLSGSAPGTAGFDQAWRALAQSDPQGFEAAQHQFIQTTHYDAARGRLGSRVPGLDVSQRSGAVQDVLWSTAVQHGPGGAANVFSRALAGTDASQLSDEEIIRRVYDERGAGGGTRYFSGSSAGVRQSVVNRFAHEREDALQMLAGERGGR